MFFYLESLILRLSNMLLIDLDTVSEFGFTNPRFIGVFSITCGTNDNILKIRTIARKICLQMSVLSTFLNVYELPKSRLAQHSHLLPGHLKTPTCFWENSALFRIFLRFDACRLLYINLKFSKPSTLFRFIHLTDLSIIS